MAHPLVDDATRWWRAHQLAEDDQVDALRRLADADDEHAQRMLAHWLARKGHTDELRRRAAAGDDHAQEWLAWLAQQP